MNPDVAWHPPTPHKLPRAFRLVPDGMAARWPPVGLRLLCAASLPLGTTALFPTITITGLSFSWLKKKVNGKEDVSYIYS